jgi:hypothetical protein
MKAMGNNFNIINETSMIGSELNKPYCKNISELLNETVEIKLQVPLIALFIDSD